MKDIPEKMKEREIGRQERNKDNGKEKEDRKMKEKVVECLLHAEPILYTV